MKAAIATLLALLGLAAASDSYSGYSGQYRGRYAGKCGNDGFYFNNQDSFVICSNGNAYHQPCAPGSRNSGYNKYNHGSSYGYTDFCDVNLVDYGYAAHGYNNQGYGHAAPSYGHSAPSYGHAAPSYGHAAPSYGHAAPSYGHAAPSYGRDVYRPERHLNQDGYATRGAYNAYNGYNRYGYDSYGRGASYGAAPSYGKGQSYGHSAGYGRQTRKGYGGTKTVTKKVTYSKH